MQFSTLLTCLYTCHALNISQASAGGCPDSSWKGTEQRSMRGHRTKKYERQKIFTHLDKAYKALVYLFLLQRCLPIPSDHASLPFLSKDILKNNGRMLAARQKQPQSSHLHVSSQMWDQDLEHYQTLYYCLKPGSLLAQMSQTAFCGKFGWLIREYSKLNYIFLDQTWRVLMNCS